MTTLTVRTQLDRARAYAWTHVTLPVDDVEALLTTVRVRDAHFVVPWARVRAVTEALCSCGGGGAGDCCDVCQVYHALQPHDENEREEGTDG